MMKMSVGHRSLNFRFCLEDSLGLICWPSIGSSLHGHSSLSLVSCMS